MWAVENRGQTQKREKGICGMLVKGDSRMVTVPQAERVAFIHEHRDRRDRNADVTVSSSCPLPLRYLFSRMKHLENVSQEEDVRHRTGNPNQEKDQWNPRMGKGTPRTTELPREQVSWKKENGCIKVGLKRRRGKKKEMIYVP